MTLTEHFDKHSLKYNENYPTARISSIKAGGCARTVVYPETKEELILAIKIAKECSVRYKTIGGCTNTFFSDNGFSGAIISTRHLSRINANDGGISVRAGVPLIKALRYAAGLGIDLGCGLYGIPGTVGGAVRNNAGAFDSEISDAFIGGEFYDEESDKIVTLDADELSFGYRSSILQSEKLVFLSGTLKGKSRKTPSILRDFERILDKRREKHPTEPSLGSFFKRCEDVIPARLIDTSGLKGIRVGNAAVSSKHAGFIINLGGATSGEIDTLARKIEEIIYNSYGVALIREAELVE